MWYVATSKLRLWLYVDNLPALCNLVISLSNMLVQWKLWNAAVFHLAVYLLKQYWCKACGGRGIFFSTSNTGLEHMRDDKERITSHTKHY